MRPPAVGIETNPRSHLAPDSFFLWLFSPPLSLSHTLWCGAVGVGGGEGICALSPSHNETRRKEGREGDRGEELKREPNSLEGCSAG